MHSVQMSNSSIWPYQVLAFWPRVDLGVMAMNGYSPKPQHYWNLTIKLFNVISGTLRRGLTLQQRCRWCILQSQPTGLGWWGWMARKSRESMQLISLVDDDDDDINKCNNVLLIRKLRNSSCIMRSTNVKNNEVSK